MTLYQMTHDYVASLEGGAAVNKRELLASAEEAAMEAVFLGAQSFPTIVVMRGSRADPARNQHLQIPRFRGSGFAVTLQGENFFRERNVRFHARLISAATSLLD